MPFPTRSAPRISHRHAQVASRPRPGRGSARTSGASGRNSPDRLVLCPVVASGDRVLDRPLAEIGGKALWTKELDAALLAGEIDFAVHSAKDVETLRPAGLVIAAVLPREDVRDVLIGAGSIAELPHGARVGTSAPRRAAQLLHARPDCTVVAVPRQCRDPAGQARGGRGRRHPARRRRAQPAGPGRCRHALARRAMAARSRPGRDRHRMPGGRCRDAGTARRRSITPRAARR